jgi:hypothetical protein
MRVACTLGEEPLGVLERRACIERVVAGMLISLILLTELLLLSVRR